MGDRQRWYDPVETRFPAGRFPAGGRRAPARVIRPRPVPASQELPDEDLSRHRPRSKDQDRRPMGVLDGVTTNPSLYAKVGRVVRRHLQDDLQGSTPGRCRERSIGQLLARWDGPGRMTRAGARRPPAGNLPAGNLVLKLDRTIAAGRHRRAAEIDSENEEVQGRVPLMSPLTRPCPDFPIS